MFALVFSTMTTPIGLFVVTIICMLVGLLYLVYHPATPSTPAPPPAPPATPAPPPALFAPISLNTSDPDQYQVPNQSLSKEEFQTLLTLIGFKVYNRGFSVLGMNLVDDGCGHMSPITFPDDNGNEVVQDGYENDMKRTIDAAKIRLNKQTKMHKNCMTAITNYRRGVEKTFQTMVDGKVTTETKTILMVSGFNNWMAFNLIPGVVIFVQCSWNMTVYDLVGDKIYDLSNKDVIVQNVAFDPADIKMIREVYEMALLTHKHEILANSPS
jgi:hypothetical protein